jgi:glycosyltransferase involved in cell wall biosynthesis
VVAQCAREFRPDVVVFEHYDTYLQLVTAVRAVCASCICVLDTVDLHHVRVRRQADLTGRPEDRDLAERTYCDEIAAVHDADVIWVVTPIEREVLVREAGVDGKRIEVVPNIHEPMVPWPGYQADERSGVVFLGGYRHSPNVDAVHWFMSEIWPLVTRDCPELTMTIAGSNPPAEFLQYANVRNIGITGFVDDHRTCLARHRIAVAPLRYGAGMKGKIGEYFACGCPTVSTSVGVEGMDVVDGCHVLVADEPKGFAEAIVRLYRNVPLAAALSLAGMKYVSERVSPGAVVGLAESLLQIRVGSNRGARRRRLRLKKVKECLRNPAVAARHVRAAVAAFKADGIRGVYTRCRMWLGGLNREASSE